MIQYALAVVRGVIQSRKSICYNVRNSRRMLHVWRKRRVRRQEGELASNDCLLRAVRPHFDQQGQSTYIIPSDFN